MRVMNLDQIRAFLAVCRTGGVQRAAQYLNLTQPAVTTRIKKLEDSLGVALFERQASGMRMTKRGELLLQYAEQFERLADRVEEVVVAPGELTAACGSAHPKRSPNAGYRTSFLPCMSNIPGRRWKSTSTSRSICAPHF